MGILASLERPKFSGAGAAWKPVTPVAGMACTVIVLHVVGWGVLVFSVVPQNLHISPTQVFGMGIGAGAYLLGMRHAFDVDHIAAIDCTTRKLIGEGLRPLSVGFWFSLGHSSLVFGLCALLSAGAQYLGSRVGEDASPLREVLGFTGTTISGMFLYILAVLNAVLLTRVATDFRRLRGGRPVNPESGSPTGLMVRIPRPVMRSVTRPWQMYLVGLLFGLGFDTATEVTLLVVAGGAATMALPWYAILILPVLFAAGMSLLDTLDGWFMNVAYGWAFSKPDRRLLYNIALTGLSAAVALSIGTMELMSVIVAKTGATGGVLAAIGSIDLTGWGYGVVGLFVLAWLVGVCTGRFYSGRKVSSVRTRRRNSHRTGQSRPEYFQRQIRDVDRSRST
jgi:nickel/cobalt transporter (NiCoT) family protein